MSDFLSGFMGTTRTWLRQDGSERLFTLKLTGIKNVLDPDPLWEHQYGGGSSIIESKTKSSSNRLKTALDAHRTSSFEMEGEFDFPVEKRRVFSDVIVWLPKKIWQSSAYEGGMRLYGMSAKLKHRHRTDFGDDIYEKRQPQYAIMPAKHLKIDEVVFQFGKGVYLPSAEDKQVREIKILQRGKSPQNLPPWTFFEKVGQSIQEMQRPAALYEKQHFLLLGQSLQESAIQSPLWLNKAGKGYMMIDTHRQPERIYGDDDYIASGETNVMGDAIHCPFHDVKNPTNIIKLIIQPVKETYESTSSYNQNRSNYSANNNINDDDIVSPTKRIPIDTGTKTDTTPISFASDTMVTIDEQNPLSNLTMIGDGYLEEIPELKYSLTIAGIVLPRLEKMRLSILKHWLLSLDQNGIPINENEQARYLIRGTSTGDLKWCKATEENWATLNLKTALPFPENEENFLMPPPLKHTQHGILLLKPPISFPVSPQKMLVGRIKQTKNPSITLNLLNRADSLGWKRKPRQQQSMGNLGLSSQHLQVQLKEKNLMVLHISRSAPTYIIDEIGNIVETLKPKSHTQINLISGYGVIIGNYYLQFHEENTRDQKA